MDEIVSILVLMGYDCLSDDSKEGRSFTYISVNAIERYYYKSFRKLAHRVIIKGKDEKDIESSDTDYVVREFKKYIYLL